MTDDYNPYRPPRASLVDPAWPGGGELANRSGRLGAWAFDAVLIWVALPFAEGSPLPGWGNVLPISAWLLLTTVLLVRRGQTLGKRLFRLRIVDARSRALAPTLRLLMIRQLPQYLLIVLVFFPELLDLRDGASLAMVVLFIDVLPVLASERRCIHDRLARTCVVNV
ncbi:MAG: RDD family protein [Gammaproteobacteria bacterium]|nr:RDD family protein [Gammaproteobacteria bacterium]